MEGTARCISRLLYDELRMPNGDRACALVRCYKTHPFGALPDDLRRFAQEASAPHGSATMFLAKPFALDTRNAGNPVVGWLDAALGLVSRFVPDYPPPIPLAEEYRKRDWL